ncbi:hypothetical protein TorRG33x02_108000 [Trema orientale]|uniref:Rapid ALkalinization Factor n=1 Tax=Trema orientale TaxID=63057 RepID=A0A2P5F6U7_TREOI|nr:hypothetical protein TorRG33x02_108000 [Trema orientale]
MKAFLALISILLATILFFPPSIVARELRPETRGPLNPGAPVFNCGRGRYRPCITAAPSPKPVCSIYKRNCPPGGH